MLVSFCFVTDYGGKHTCSVTGCNINSIYKDGIQTLKITLWGHHMEAKEKENIYHTMKLPKVNWNVTLMSPFIQKTHTQTF